MSVGIVRYPGSNCDYDTLRYFDDSFFIWHKETEFPENLKLLVLPGGFAFGDRLYDNATGSYTISPGTMAINSPVSKIIYEAVERKIPVLGICNGFQILTQMGLLPGKLLLNKEPKFVCKKVDCCIHYNIFDNKTKFLKTDFFIANSYGRYYVEEEDYNEMKYNNQIFITYDEPVDEIGSMHNIAGVTNKEKTIFGMMPHPERNNQNLNLRNYSDYIKPILNKILTPKKEILNTQTIFHNKISELMNSEHISYKSTRKYLRSLHTDEPWVIQGPGENAGIVDIGDGYGIAIRIESHNHPTFINPFEGAATGVGGILRDIFTMGARPIGILDFLRFGTDDNSKQLLDKAIDGISYYGNCVGVPNIGGDCYVNKMYNKNPLVNVACLGIVETNKIIYGNATNDNQLLIYVGSKTGNEGIGGAAMASNAFNSNVDVSTMQDNVQKSDPFLEKLLLDACCEISDKELVIGMQDMGAGGLLCASQEVIKRGREKTGLNLGCNIYLTRVPTKYKMDLCDILISESQERMFIVAEENNIKEIFSIFDKWDLEYSVVGETTINGKYSVYNDKHLLYTEEMTNYKDIFQDWPVDIVTDTDVKIKDGENSHYFDTFDTHRHITKVKNMDLWKVYDYTVGNRTIKGPNEPRSYSILDLYEINKKLIVTWGTFGDCSCMLGGKKAKPLCIVNCLNFGHPKDSMKDFKEIVEIMGNRCKKFSIPVVGGNVSLYNSTDDVSIKPTVIIVMIGLIE
mgnify:CR=1 FL=1